MEYSSSKLESWIHHSVKKTLYVHNGSQSMAREQINKYHVVCLQKTLNYAYKRSDFYRKHFDDAGFRPEQFKSLADLAKIPFTEQEFLHNQPYKLLCISAGDVERVVTFTTSGTTGPQKKVFFSSDDLNNIVKFMGIGLSHVINGGEAIVILLPDTGPNGEARLLAKGASTDRGGSLYCRHGNGHMGATGVDPARKAQGGIWKHIQDVPGNPGWKSALRFVGIRSESYLRHL